MISLCAKRGPGGSGRMDTSFLLVAGEYRWHGGDERVEREWKIPISVQRERLDNKKRCRTGKIRVSIKGGVQREKTAWDHTHPLHGYPHARWVETSDSSFGQSVITPWTLQYYKHLSKGKCFLGMERIHESRLSHSKPFSPYTGFAACVRRKHICVYFTLDTAT